MRSRLLGIAKGAVQREGGALNRRAQTAALRESTARAITERSRLDEGFPYKGDGQRVWCIRACTRGLREGRARERTAERWCSMRSHEGRVAPLGIETQIKRGHGSEGTRRSRPRMGWLALSLSSVSFLVFALMPQRAPAVFAI